MRPSVNGSRAALAAAMHVNCSGVGAKSCPPHTTTATSDAKIKSFMMPRHKSGKVPVCFLASSSTNRASFQHSIHTLIILSGFPPINLYAATTTYRLLTPSLICTHNNTPVIKHHISAISSMSSDPFFDLVCLARPAI